MALSSTSTNAEVKAAYDDNASYDIDGSVIKCRDFIVAARVLLRRMAEEIDNGNTRVKDSYQKIEGQLISAMRWRRVNDPAATSSVHGGCVRHVSFEDSRR